MRTVPARCETGMLPSVDLGASAYGRKRLVATDSMSELRTDMSVTTSVSWRHTEWLRYASERLRSVRHLTDQKNGRQTQRSKVDSVRGVIWS